MGRDGFNENPSLEQRHTLDGRVGSDIATKYRRNPFRLVFASDARTHRCTIAPQNAFNGRMWSLTLIMRYLNEAQPNINELVQAGTIPPPNESLLIEAASRLFKWMMTAPLSSCVFFLPSAIVSWTVVCGQPILLRRFRIFKTIGRLPQLGRGGVVRTEGSRIDRHHAALSAQCRK